MLMRWFAMLFALSVLHGGARADTPALAAQATTPETARASVEAVLDGEAPGSTGRVDFDRDGAEDFLTLDPPDGWYYDATLTEMHPGIATFYSGSNVISFSGYKTRQNGQEALHFLNAALTDGEQEPILLEDGPWYRIQGTEELESGQTRYYVHLSQQGALCHVTWAKLYCPYPVPAQTQGEPDTTDALFLEFAANCTLDE